MAVFLAALPALYAQIAAPKGSTYLGFEFNTDDHMVYAAWMRQAMSGHFFLDNRFTTDPQPGLTVHLYFWILGLVAKITGIPFAANFARLLFTGLFVPLLYRLVRRVSGSVYVTRLAVTLTVVGGGIGFLVWHNFGVEIVRPGPVNEALGGIMLGRLPIDVWQPEAFVFPSMLTNGLFMVSLCLILVVFQSFLDAQDSWRPVLWGALALGVLMNIHSYDVLMIGFTMVGFLAAQIAAKQASGGWVAKGLVIGAGAIPAALWFVHVLHSDAVFQARAATPTFSANFRQVFFGYFLMIALAFPGLILTLKARRQQIGIGLLGLLLIGLFLAAGSRPQTGESYFLSLPLWGVAFVVALAAIALMSTDKAAFNLILAWAVMGLIGLYFPALFQRKLAMGLSVPWAILATLGFATMVRTRDRSSRNLATVLSILLMSATSICWISRREPYLIRQNVSNTTQHPVFLSRDEQEIVRLLNEEADKTSRVVVLAMPGSAAPDLDGAGNRIPDEFSTPAMPDLNPIVSGLTGVYTYAGHWSETPDYLARRAEATKAFLASVPPEERKSILDKIHPQFIIAPSTDTYGAVIHDMRDQGEVVFSGNQFQLIRIRKGTQ